METDSICCPVCSSPLVVIEFGCTRCRTPHHPECFSYADGCAIYGCGGKDAGSIAFEPPDPVRVNTPPETTPAIPPDEDQGFVRRIVLAAVTATSNLPWILVIVGISWVSRIRFPYTLWPCASASFITVCKVSLEYRPKGEVSRLHGLFGRIPGLFLSYIYQLLAFSLFHVAYCLNSAASFGSYSPYPTLGNPRAGLKPVTEIAILFFGWAFLTCLMAPFVIAIEPECTALEAIRRSGAVSSRRFSQLLLGVIAFVFFAFGVQTVELSFLPWMGHDDPTINCGAYAYAAFALCHYLVLLILEDRGTPLLTRPR